MWAEVEMIKKQRTPGLLKGTSGTMDGKELPVCQDLAPLVIYSHLGQHFKINGHMSIFHFKTLDQMAMQLIIDSWVIKVFHRSFNLVDPTTCSLTYTFSCQFLI